jgi:hypothetical protein
MVSQDASGRSALVNFNIGTILDGLGIQHDEDHFIGPAMCGVLIPIVHD